MARWIIILAAMAGLAATPATAEKYRGCSATQTEQVTSALQGAKDLTIKASVAVADTPDFARWFGEYSQANAEHVRASLKSIATAIRSGSVTAQCELIREDSCAAGEYAYVFSDEPYLMYLCPPFFDLPTLEVLQPGTRRSNNGTQEGTIVHEVSHFMLVAATEDHCYTRNECSAMARRDPRRAVENADSYQYFTEDVTYYARQPIGNKPPPAPRANR